MVQFPWYLFLTKKKKLLKKELWELGLGFGLRLNKVVLGSPIHHYLIFKLQYVGKNEALFNITLNKHRKEVKDPEAILADKHFQKSGNRFTEHARFTKIDRLTSTNFDK